MRDFINLIRPLTEAYLDTLQIDPGYGEKLTVELFQNPSRSEFAKLLRTGEDKDSARGLLFGDGLLVAWNVNQVEHMAVQDEIGRFNDECERLFLFKDGVGFYDVEGMGEPEGTDAETIRIIKASTVLQHIYGQDFPVFNQNNQQVG